MRQWGRVAGSAIILICATGLHAQVRLPYQLLDQEPENIYLPPVTPDPAQLINRGGVHFSLEVSYLSTYMYRGIDQSTPPKRNERGLQFDGRLMFDLGKLPHPFVGVFSNIFNKDPVSRFEEVRPYAGLEWTIRPIKLSGGFNGYIFPNREGKDTQEVWTQIQVDDSRFFHTDAPFVAPYVYAAYDLQRYEGVYLEGGIRHDFVIDDTGLTLTAVGDFAYVGHDRYFRGTGRKSKETGLQHYDGGVVLTYDLNHPLSITTRYGQWELKALLMYSGPIESGIRANSRLWGGVGLLFRY